MSLSVATTRLRPLVPLMEHAEAWAWSPRDPWNAGSWSIAVFPGEAATREVVRSDGERQALIGLVRRFTEYGLSWAGGESSKISPLTEATAERFLYALPLRKALPKVSPDGEGGLMMVWEAAGGPLLVTVDEFRLHVVIRATTAHAEYIPDIRFDALEIPRCVVEAIPAR